ncbi:AAA family ATPase [Undibacterium seohonense]|uniref:non-specific serine/threonine protein kinase n=1 Tax=Undibacterium seohonense TaxID=1344950 RepID=A0ABR6X0V3_9BURK|nr:ATPase domain-containing protein [Undibacterium seohonense]MBC3806542.1 AAA family ATPase [Undibacterium seohonense]
MSEIDNQPVRIQKLLTGVPGLDALLGGGLPEFSFNLLAGTPGSGKTTLAHQMMFALANPDRRAIFFTVLGESPLKMLRYQQQFPFFDFAKVNSSIKFVNLAADLLDGDFDRVLSRIIEEVQGFSPGLVFVDSFRSIVQSARSDDPGISGLQHLVQQLGMQMSSWQATSFLIGEYLVQEAESSPIFTVADGIIWMSQMSYRDSMIRKIQVVKMRGQAQSPGLHTFKISDSGIEVFSRAVASVELNNSASQVQGDAIRMSTGNTTLDQMMGGGVPQAYSVLVVGPSGSGKTILATQFLAEGVRVGEKGVIAAFEKSPHQLLSQELKRMIESGNVGVINTQSLDLSLDEIFHDMVENVRRLQAKRLVIDSLSGFELALSAVFREDFREALYRMVASLTAMGVTVLMTAELEDQYTSLKFSSSGNAFLADAIIMQRYVEISGQLRRVIAVVKVRSSTHSKDICFYTIAEDDICIGEALTNYVGILSGLPERV